MSNFDNASTCEQHLPFTNRNVRVYRGRSSIRFVPLEKEKSIGRRIIGARVEKNIRPESDAFIRPAPSGVLDRASRSVSHSFAFEITRLQDNGTTVDRRYAGRTNGATTYRFYAIKTSNDRGRATRERARTYTRRVYYRYNFRCPATSPPIISVMCQPAGIGTVVLAVSAEREVEKFNAADSPRTGPSP